MTRTAPERRQATPDDHVLLTRVLSGDQAAWRTFHDCYRRLACRCIGQTLARHLGSAAPDQIDDVLGDFWLNLLGDDRKRLRAYDPQRGVSVSSWLGLIAVRTTVDALRRHGRACRIAAAVATAPSPTSGPPDALAQLVAREGQHRFRRQLTERLTPLDDRFLALTYDKELFPTEIAVALSVSVNTVYAKKNKVLRRLRRELVESSVDQLALAA